MYWSLYPDVLQLIPDGTAAYIITVRIKLPQSSWAGVWTELGNKHKKQQIQVTLWYWVVWFDSLEPKNQLILGFPDQMGKNLTPDLSSSTRVDKNIQMFTTFFRWIWWKTWLHTKWGSLWWWSSTATRVDRDIQMFEHYCRWTYFPFRWKTL